MTINCNHGEWYRTFVMNLVNMFVEELCVKQPMDVVEADLMNKAVGAKLPQKDGKAWNVPGIIGNRV